MSNPAVIILANCLTKGGHSFRIEDNIGESIHIHYHDIRIDLTVKEFLDFADVIAESVNDILDVEGFCVEDYDPRFLAELGDKLLDLQRVELDQVALDQIEVYVETLFGGYRLRKLPNSRVVRALSGDEKLFKAYSQENAFGESNMTRLESIVQSIRDNGYPRDGKHIVFMNDQNIIRDGQHRASALYHLNGSMSIPVRRLHFKGNRYNCSRRPFLRQLTCLPIYFTRVMPKLVYRYARRWAGKTYRTIKRFRKR